MKRVISTMLAVALLLGLGALAVLARPGAQAVLAPAAVAAAPVAFQGAAGPDMVPSVTTQKYNMIALPLDSQTFFTSQGYTFNASGLAQYIGSSVVQVSRWVTTTQSYQHSAYPFTNNNFPLRTGGVYVVLLDNTNPDLKTFSIVGNVPPASVTTPQGTPGRVEYRLKGASPTCKNNMITVPLDRSDLDTAKKLAQAIGNVYAIRQWRAELPTQAYQTSTTPFDNNNFAVKVGYPYVVCVLAEGDQRVWP